MVRLAILLCVVSGLARGQETPRCAIDVTVTDERSGGPLAKATLILRRTGAGAQPKVFDSVSDEAGKFAMKEVAAGDYLVGATAEGHSHRYVPVRCNAETVHVSIALASEAVVSGAVTDEDGRFVAGARVSLLRRMYTNGERRFAPMGDTIAGNDGRYRMESLPEGTYYVSATLPPGNKTISGDPYVPTFYPNAVEIAGAAPVRIRGPGEVGGTDIRLKRAHAFTIKGHLSRGEFAENLRDFAIHLNPTDAGVPRIRTASVNGEFEFSGVLPGSYALLARKSSSTDPSARSMVTVVDSEVDDVVLTLSGGLQIDGTITYEDKGAHLSSVAEVSLVSREASEVAASRSYRGNDFAFRNIPASLYRVALSKYGHPIYVKALRVDGRDVPDWIADLTATGAHSMEIVLGTDGGRVTGFARDGSGNPREKTVVILAPAGAVPLTTPQFATTVSDDKGRYIFTGVQPGAYKVFAWEKVDAGMVQNRQVLDQFESQCADVVVAPNGTANADVTAISASATAALE